MTLVKSFNVEKLSVKAFDTRKAMGKCAVEDAVKIIRELLKEKKELNFIFAAAPSQNELLESLSLYKDIEWERINAFHMDEYAFLDYNAPQRFGNFLKEKIFSKVNFKSVNYIDGNSMDLEKECKRYGKLLEDNIPDIVFMGIGENGHIAFNDPSVASFKDKYLVKVVELDAKCRNQQVNDKCFSTIDDVPKHALTLTIPILTSAKYIYCVVPGDTKSEAVKNTLEGEINENCPASILRTHDNAVLYIDENSGKFVL
jgi:glucosamine-6-phosphate deaminase